jgi:hypothetical protein
LPQKFIFIEGEIEDHGLRFKSHPIISINFYGYKNNHEYNSPTWHRFRGHLSRSVGKAEKTKIEGDGQNYFYIRRNLTKNAE